MSTAGKRETQPLTTKEIARRAVEEEFNERKRKMKGKNSDYYSDDDEVQISSRKKYTSSSDDELNKIPSIKEREKQANKYRDRAKERREGSKTDEQVPVVKGLDYAALRREKELRGIPVSAHLQGARLTPEHQKQTKDDSSVDTIEVRCHHI